MKISTLRKKRNKLDILNEEEVVQHLIKLYEADDVAKPRDVEISRFTVRLYRAGYNAVRVRALCNKAMFNSNVWGADFKKRKI